MDHRTTSETMICACRLDPLVPEHYHVAGCHLLRHSPESHPEAESNHKYCLGDTVLLLVRESDCVSAVECTQATVYAYYVNVLCSMCCEVCECIQDLSG